MNIEKLIGSAVLAILGVIDPTAAATDAERIAELEAKAQAMEESLAELQGELAQAKQQAASAEDSAVEWKRTTAVTHLAGYAAVGYTDQKNETGVFDVANFNPIFHFQYADKVLWEAELEIEVAEDGETEIGLEYTTIDFFVNDYLVFVGGKFLSPIGNFRQNLHPAWINKLPAAPPGFGHDGAAPLAEVGFQLRGGFPAGGFGKLTYAVYVGNGPVLEAEDGEVEGIESEGFVSDEDGSKVWGGRVGFLPLPRLEIGLSAATGDTAVTSNDGLGIEDDPQRDYRALAVDFSYQWRSLDLRGEYVQQDIGDALGSVAEEGGKWETWYLQGAYKFARAKWEAVLRYADFDSPHASHSQEQITAGINYLVAPNAMVKLAYEFNDGLSGEPTDDDRWLVQLAYGY